MEYMSQRGDRYFIYQGKTKTGKPKFYASKRPTSEKGVRADSLPDGLEIFENPSNGLVSIRRRKPSRIVAAERDLIARMAVEHSAFSCVRTMIDGDQIVVYTPDTDPATSASMLEKVFGPLSTAKIDEWTKRNAHYTAEMRFTLVDEDARHYTADRYCYRGSIDNWIQVSGEAPLESLAEKLLPHLGRESFYDLSFSI